MIRKVLWIITAIGRIIGALTMRAVLLTVVIGLAALCCSCTQTAEATSKDGTRCQTTAHNYLFYADTTSQCWDKNGNPFEAE